VLVKRTVSGLSGAGGTTRRYIERMDTRYFSDVKDSIFADSAVVYDGTNSTATTMTLTGSGWTYNDTLTLTASASYFATSDVGDEIHLTGADGEIIRFTIEAYASATVVTGKPHKTVPASLQATATAVWGHAKDSIERLWHIEGEDVSALGDGFVASSPNNAEYTVVTVANGIATFDEHYVKLNVGLPVTADIETLDIDTTSGETLMGKNTWIGGLILNVESSRGIFAGPNSADLTEFKLRAFEDPAALPELVTDKVEVNIQPEWSQGGRVFIRQFDPIPVTILAVAPAGLVPINRG
jgi:hypothetical protein